MAFAEAMKTMTEELAKSRADRASAMTGLHSACSSDRKERRATIHHIGEDVKRLFGNVHVQIQHFHSDRGKMRKELRHMLGEFFGQTQKYVHGFLKQCSHDRENTHAHRMKMVEELRDMLEGFKASLQKETRRFLTEFRTHHKAMSGKQREELDTYCHGLQRDMGQLRRHYQQAQKALRADFEKAREYWQGFAGQMPRANAVTRTKTSSLQNRLMTALKGSPDGMTKKELSYALGMPEKALVRPLTHMRREKHIRRRKGAFFAK